MQGTHTTNPPLYLTPLALAFYLALCGSTAAQPVSKQPAWVFPIYFEEGGGQRDTVYLCYDSSATLNEDPEFGDTLVPIDTTKFNAFFYTWQDTLALKKGVVPLINNIYIDDINFINGILPVKINWNKQLLYSDSLPFPDQSPAPRAQGELWVAGGMQTPDGCGWGDPLLMTDSTPTWCSWCASSDSAIFVDFFGGSNTPIPYVTPQIKPWTGCFVGVPEKDFLRAMFTVYPNPAGHKIVIQTKIGENYKYLLYDILGRIRKRMESTVGNSEVDVSGLEKGIYTLTIVFNNNQLTQKVIVMH